MESPAHAVLRGETPHRLPVAPVAGADHAAHRAGIPLRGAMSDPALLAEVFLAAWRAYESDLVVVFSDVTVEAEALGAGVAWPEGEPPRVIDHAAPGALRTLDPYREGRLPVVLDAARRVIAGVAGEVPVLVSLEGPFSLAALACGCERLLTDVLEAPERARKTLAAAAECQTAYVRAIVETGGIPLIGDPYASGSVLGPDHFRDLALPGLATLVEEAHARGALAAIHICGDVAPLLDPLLEAGADLLHLEEADLEKVAASGTAVMTGVPTEILLAGSEADIRAAVADAIDAIPPGSRFILATACDIPTETPERNVRVMVEAARAHA